MTKKQGKSWSELSSGERKAVVVGWVAIIVIAGWFFLPSKEEQPSTSTVTEIVAAEVKAPDYTVASPDAFAAATRLMAELDKTMLDSSAVMSNGDVVALGAHSRRFGDLVASARKQFGATISESLGRCGIASNNARSWWQAQLAAAHKNGVEPIPGAIKEALDQYQENRLDCLASAGNTANG